MDPLVADDDGGFRRLSGDDQGVRYVYRMRVGGGGREMIDVEFRSR